MKKNYVRKFFWNILLGTTMGIGNICAQTPVTLTYTYTGTVQQLTIPFCVGSMTIDVKGAAGSNGGASGNPGGNGGQTRAVMNGTAGAVLNIYVGGQGSVTAGGFNGGGNGGISLLSNGGGGGGASDIRLNGNALTDRIIIAGGGGGGGGSNFNPTAIGGAGGGGNPCLSPFGVGGGFGGGYLPGAAGLIGACAGGSTNIYASGGSGAGLTSGGGGGGQPAAVGGAGGMGCNGALGVGGNGGGTSSACGGVTGGQNGPGGGGGGYYGGGGGMSGTGSGHGGGGGGSSYMNNVIFSSPSFSGGIQTGHGSVVITYVLFGPAVTVTSPSLAICNGNSTTLNGGSVNSYTWQPVGAFAGSTNQNVTVSPTVTTTYSVSGSNSLNCVSNTVVTVIVNTAVPTVAASSNTPSVCYSNTITLSASGALTYTFSNGISNGVAFLPSPGVNNYSITGGNACGTNSTVVTVTVSALPVTAGATSTLICAGLPATLTAGGAGNFTWTPASSAINTSSTYIINPSATTIYTVVGATGQCGGITTITVTTKANPTLNIVASSSNICSGNSVTLTAVGNATSYAWSPGGQTGNSISTTPSQSTLYTATGTNSNNCNTFAQQVVLVSPNPTIAIAVSDAVVCAGGPSTLTASGAATYSWTTANTASVLVHPTTSTTYSVTGSYTTGCFSTASAIVSIFVPSIAVSGNTSTCPGVNVGINASGASTYTWTNNGVQVQGITVNPTANTIYTVIGSVTDQISGISCNATNTLQVTINSNPTVSATSNRTGNTICPGESAILTAEGAGTSGTYTWTGGSGAVVGISNTVSPIANLNYSVSGKDANGCKGTGNIQIMVVLCAGIPGVLANTASLLIYPNPSSGAFNISASQAITLHIINELGQQVSTITLNGTSNSSTTVSNLAHGIYFIMGSNENGHVKEKIIITK